MSGDAPRRRLLAAIALIGFGLTASSASASEIEPRASFYDALAEGDVKLAWSAFQDTLETRPSRQAGDWHNAATGSEGTVTPLRTYRIASGTYCRDYLEVVTLVARVTARSGTACRKANGLWIPLEL